MEISESFLAMFLIVLADVFLQKKIFFLNLKISFFASQFAHLISGCVRDGDPKVSRASQ